MRFLWIVFFVAAAFVVLVILIPLLHLALGVAILVAAAIFLMAVWKAMFGPKTPSAPPPTPAEPPRLESRS
jgi:membrane protein implicated in regulation of membrane protease activity